MHPERRKRTQWLATLDPETQFETIHRELMLTEFDVQMRTGLHMAYYRTFASPTIAQVLAGTGHTDAEPAKRSYDTGIVMYELAADGLRGPRGRRMVSLMNRLHRDLPIADRDYRYVLSTFAVSPVRWVQQYGWRRLSPAEITGTWNFYRELGRLMNVPDVPATFDEAASQFDEYEANCLGRTDHGLRLMSKTQHLLEVRLPRRLRPHTDTLTSAMIGDARLCAALDLPAPSPVWKTAVRTALKGYAAKQRVSPPRPGPWFRPGQATRLVYPHGYQLEDLGPHGASATPQG